MKRILVLPGDGIGPEVANEAIKVLECISEITKEKFEFEYELIGGISIDQRGVPITDEVIEKAKKSDAVFLGAVGGPNWDNLPMDKKPESGLLKLRKSLNLWANIRPIKILMKKISPLRPALLKKIDFVVIRELTSDIYFGTPRAIEENRAYNTASYTREEVERIARLAFELARKRKKKVTSIDKANVLEVSAFWRKIVSEISKDYPDISLEHVYVDAASFYLIVNPARFDVLLCPNLFGDILSDEGGAIIGSLGLCPSASLGDSNFGLYEPVHGSAPDIAGKGIANPIASILSAAMLLRYSFNMEKEAKAVEKAVEKTIKDGLRTQDIAERNQRPVSTREFGDYVVKKIKEMYL
ncbi:MAG: 3-isopropylmalate dehydrogenase [Candidatus Calescibacterium sp.]|nr:3-isopropylmalate dehydrogenase [Candidatus Calescibacterium sp.]MDW8088015.1 3-isopropylmalate dehydrogenase [Candidatus Calescibacterium sp.]